MLKNYGHEIWCLCKLFYELDKVVKNAFDEIKNNPQYVISVVQSGQLAQLIVKSKERLENIKDSSMAVYFESDNAFGREVSRAFPCVSYDIWEAAKCYTVERSTASVFHSIRALEAAIRAIARCLGIQDPTRAKDRMWGSILTDIKKEYERRWPTTSGRMHGDGSFFEEAHALLAAIQNPYRNATMDLDQTYTQEDARHMLEVIRGFMRKIASRMDENGLLSLRFGPQTSCAVSSNRPATTLRSHRNSLSILCSSV